MLYLTWCFNLQAEPLLHWLAEPDLRRQFDLHLIAIHFKKEYRNPENKCEICLQIEEKNTQKNRRNAAWLSNSGGATKYELCWIWRIYVVLQLFYFYLLLTYQYSINDFYDADNQADIVCKNQNFIISERRRYDGALTSLSLICKAKPNANCVEFESSSTIVLILFPANIPIFNKRFLWCW